MVERDGPGTAVVVFTDVSTHGPAGDCRCADLLPWKANGDHQRDRGRSHGRGRMGSEKRREIQLWPDTIGFGRQLAGGMAALVGQWTPDCVLVSIVILRYPSTWRMVIDIAERRTDTIRTPHFNSPERMKQYQSWHISSGCLR